MTLYQLIGLEGDVCRLTQKLAKKFNQMCKAHCDAKELKSVLSQIYDCTDLLQCNFREEKVWIVMDKTDCGELKEILERRMNRTHQKTVCDSCKFLKNDGYSPIKGRMLYCTMIQATVDARAGCQMYERKT